MIPECLRDTLMTRFEAERGEGVVVTWRLTAHGDGVLCARGRLAPPSRGTAPIYLLFSVTFVGAHLTKKNNNEKRKLLSTHTQLQLHTGRQWFSAIVDILWFYARTYILAAASNTTWPYITWILARLAGSGKRVNDQYVYRYQLRIPDGLSAHQPW